MLNMMLLNHIQLLILSSVKRQTHMITYLAHDYNSDDSDTSMIRESSFKPAPNINDYYLSLWKHRCSLVN